MPLVSRLAEPFHRSDRILRYYIAIIIAYPKHILRIGMPLISRPAKPSDGLGKIAANTVAL